MIASPHNPTHPSPVAAAADVVDPPAWVIALVPRAATSDGGVVWADSEPSDIPQETADDTAALRFVSVRTRSAHGLAEPDFSDAVTSAYRAIFSALHGGGLWPVRFWNHIPGLHDRMGPGLDRYMAFNAGRFAAMQEWFGGVGRVRAGVATASGIGHTGDDFVVHCLAAGAAGTSVENPRQVPAYLYSKRFGPTPPCFARATITTLGGQRVLLVAGTASIRGEESVHIGDLAAQVQETLTNLRAVIAAAQGLDAGTPQPGQLDRLREVRVYHPRPEDAGTLAGLLSGVFAGAPEVQVMRADLCRGELLVEIEGVADLEDAGGAP